MDGKGMRRAIQTIMAAAAVAFLLIGQAAGPAGAESRDQMKNDINDFVSWCFSQGGVPDTTGAVFGGEEEMAAKCILRNGEVFECVWATWLEGRECSLHDQYDPTLPPDLGIAPPLTRPKDTHPPTGAGTTLASDDRSGPTVTNSGTGAGKVTTKDTGAATATPTTRISR